MKLTKGKIIAAFVVLCVLAAAFFLQGQDGTRSAAEPDNTENTMPGAAVSGEAGDSSGATSDRTGQSEETGGQKPEEVVPAGPTEQKPEENKPAEPEQSEPVEEPSVEPVPETTPPPEEPDVLTCTLSISCATVLDNMDKLTPGKEDLIPADGWLLAPIEVEFTQGESVFDVLQRELKNRNMHFEYSTAALYDTAYIEGICNLYEYDCGELSGWEYAVNGEFFSYGSSQFTLYDGDEVAWVYTCDLGADVGDGEE